MNPTAHLAMEELPVKKLMTPADVARHVGLTPAAVRAMEARGELVAAARTERGHRLFRKSDVDALMQRRARNRERVRVTRLRGGSTHG